MLFSRPLEDFNEIIMNRAEFRKHTKKTYSRKNEVDEFSGVIKANQLDQKIEEKALSTTNAFVMTI